MDKIKIGISIGDPNGVGLEIILSVFEKKDLFKYVIPILFGPKKIIDFQKKHFNKKTELNYIKNTNQLKEGFLNIIQTATHDYNVEFGVQSKEAGIISYESLSKCTDAINDGMVEAIITAPINKKAIQSKRFKFPGHTDFLEGKFEGKALMFMVSKDLRIALVTDHVPINSVSKMISSKRLIIKINQVLYSLKNDFGIVNPKIAVLGLNPHSGDDGVIGSEDDDILKPAISKSKKDDIIDGPFAADGFFASKKYKEYDAIIAMYHDQGLIPFKTLTFGNGVNFTAGLNIIRTSPDHGTAFDIAGKGTAISNSFKAAILESFRISKNRSYKLI